MNSILGHVISPVNYRTVTEAILAWVNSDGARCIYAANVHMLMEAHDSPAFRAVLARADLLTPDGMPLVWLLRLKGYKDQPRVYGPTLMLHVLEMAARESIPVGFYGSDESTLRQLVDRMQARFPALKVVYAYSPPFRPLTAEEDAQVCAEITASGARILFVGLGCPRQEVWMDAHRDKIKAVMLGVGAAFDFHAGSKRQAPAWMQRLGLEWLFRLVQEPTRLARRYLVHNPRFIVLAMLDLLGRYRPGK